MRCRLVVVGAAGRMGRRIISLAGESDKFELIAAIERQDHPDIGKDAGVNAHKPHHALVSYSYIV